MSDVSLYDADAAGDYGDSRVGFSQNGTKNKCREVRVLSYMHGACWCILFFIFHTRPCSCHSQHTYII